MKQNTLRIINSCVVAIAACGVGIYNTFHRNSSNSIDYQLNVDYQAHSVASIIGSIIPGIIAGVAFYWLTGWLARRKQEKLNQVGDVKFYDEITRELQEKPLVPGLWTKAFSEMDGDDAKARALYIKYRVAQLMEASYQRLEGDRHEEQRREGPQRAALPPIIVPTRASNHGLAALLAIFFGVLSGSSGLCGLMLVTFLLGGGASHEGKTDSLAVLILIVGATILLSLSFLMGYATRRFLKQTH